jgi:pimeloyl-ACP methyl ester carboxylesterase
MKAYCISGLGADHRVYQALDLKYELVALEWIEPRKKETLAAYAQRLAAKIDQKKPFVLIGVSFGGMLAVEIAHQLQPVQTILISSVEVAEELPKWYRWLGKLEVVGSLPVYCFRLPFWAAKWAFGTRHPLLKAILKDSNPAFTKWAIAALLSWNNTQRLSNRLKIGGAKDRLLPAKEVDYVIEDGHHFMIVDKAAQLSALINSLA